MSSVGARRAGLLPVRLPAEALPVFRERLDEAYPEGKSKIEIALFAIRGGKWNESRFGPRPTCPPRFAALFAT